jgi:molecular chaperone HtpG
MISAPRHEQSRARTQERALASQIEASDKEKFEDIIWLLFDEARVMEGERPADAFAARLTRVLLSAVGPIEGQKQAASPACRPPRKSSSASA